MSDGKWFQQGGVGAIIAIIVVILGILMACKVLPADYVVVGLMLAALGVARLT